MAKTTVLEGAVEITGDYSKALAATDMAATTIKERMGETAEEGGAAAKLLAGEWGVSMEAMERASAHAFGRIGREFLEGGALAIGLTAATELAIDFGKELFEAGDKAKELAEAFEDGMAKAREEIEKANDALATTLAHMREINAEQDKRLADVMNPGGVDKGASGFVKSQAEAIGGNPNEKAFDKAKKLAEEQAADADKAKAEIEQQMKEKDKAYLELEKQQEEAAKAAAERLKEYDKQTKESLAKADPGWFNNLIGRNQGAVTKETSERSRGRQDLIDQAAEEQRKLAESAAAARESMIALNDAQDKNAKQLNDVKNAAPGDLKTAKLKDDFAALGAGLKKDAEKFAESLKKGLKAGGGERAKGQAILDRDEQRKAENSERMGRLQKELDDHPTRMHGLESLGSDIQAGIGGNSTAQKMEEMKKLQADNNKLTADIKLLLSGRLPKDGAQHVAVFGGGGH